LKKDIQKLQGTWSIVALEVDGNEMPPMGQVLIKGDKFDSLSMGATYRGTLKLDATTRPKQFDLHFTEGPEKGNTSLGIYELDGDTWKICLTFNSTQRPTAFATKPGSGHALETLKRGAAVRGRVPVKRSAAVAMATKKARGPATEFEGEWDMVSGVMNGQPMDKSMVQWVKRITQGNETTVVAGPQTMLKVQFTHDPSNSPKTIDYVNLVGPNKSKTQQGIYKFDGEMLTVCVAAPGAARPAEFVSKPGDGRTLTVWKASKR
jgi:uncharacterized protein (TIGR03067 family)